MRRQRDPVHERGVTAVLTPKGRAYRRELARTHIERIRRHFLDPTTHHGGIQLTESLAPILKELDAQDVNHPPSIQTRLTATYERFDPEP